MNLNDYIVPIVIGVLIIIIIIVGTTLYNNGKKEDKEDNKKNIYKKKLISDFEDTKMTKAEKVGFVNFGDTEDMEFVNTSDNMN